MPVPRRKATFGSLLREHRLSAGLTQEALAERSSVSPRTIQEVEAGSVQPRRSTALALAQALGLPDTALDELLTAAASRPGRRVSRTSGDDAGRQAAPDVLPMPAPPAAEAVREPTLVALPRPAPTNVPWPVSSLLGREAELAAIRALVAEERQRLVTLTGVGGSGKTRLAVQVAADQLDSFIDGVWFVDLAPTASPGLVPRVVAGTLGVREVQDVPLLDTLIGFLGRKRLLLVLDNCEHLIDACAALADRLLTTCPDLSILATSREPLRIAGERRWPVQPLAIPDLEDRPSFAMVAGVSSVRLFVERARAIDPDFTLTEVNAASVAQVCVRLDGIPLAIELAASRMGVLAVDQIAERLDDAFRLLAGGPRAGPTRQQTLEAALTWSYDLLTAPEQATFRALSVFAGSWALEAAEAVCDGGARAVGTSAQPMSAPRSGRGPMVGVIEGRGTSRDDSSLDLLGRLVEKSLVVIDQTPLGRRYRLLEPVRQYAYRELLASGEDQQVYGRHAAYYADLAEHTMPKLRGPEQVAWQARLARDEDNLRAALRWADGRGETVTVARLAVALVPFWEVQGSLREGRRWLDTVLVAVSPLPGELRARVLLGTGRLAHWQADLDEAAARFEESRALASELGDRPTIAESLTWLGTVRRRQRADAEAIRLLEEGLAEHRALGDEWGAALALYNLGMVAANEGAFGRAAPYFEESLRLYRALGDGRLAAVTGLGLGTSLTATGDLERAGDLLRDSMTGLQEAADQAYLLSGLLTMAWLAAWMGQPVRAARLIGAAEALREVLGASLAPVNRDSQEQALDRIRSRLGAAELDAAIVAGRELAPDDAIDEALRVVAPEAGDHTG